MKENRKQMAGEVIRELAGKFLAENSTSKASLMTVTKVSISPDRANAKIYFTTLPESGEKGALDFAKRHRSEFRQYLKDNSLLSRIPFIDFDIDYGERNRQNIEEISKRAGSFEA